MVNYANGKVYKITSPNHTQCYVGSTTRERLCQRMEKHRTDYNRYLKNTPGAYYYASFEILKAGDAVIEWLENAVCESRDQLRAREQHWINQLDCVNKHKAYITKEERKAYNKKWDQDHLDERREYKRKYAIENKDAIKTKKKNYRQLNIEKIKAQTKAYRDATKEERAAKRKANYETNKEDIAAARKAVRDANKDEANRKQREYRAKKKAEKEAAKNTNI